MNLRRLWAPTVGYPHDRLAWNQLAWITLETFSWFYPDYFESDTGFSSSLLPLRMFQTAIAVRTKAAGPYSLAVV